MITFGIGWGLIKSENTAARTDDFVHTVGRVTAPGLWPGLGFFFPRWLAGGEADEGPKVKERDNDEASTDPNPDPLRGCDC
jgi:hypothetical protein